MLLPRNQSFGDARLQDIVSHGMAKCHAHIESKVGHGPFEHSRAKGLGIALFRQPVERLLSQTFHADFFQDRMVDRVNRSAAEGLGKPQTCHKMTGAASLMKQMYSKNLTWEQKLTSFLQHPGNIGCASKMLLGYWAGANVNVVIKPCEMQEARRRVEEDFFFVGIQDECK